MNSSEGAAAAEKPGRRAPTAGPSRDSRGTARQPARSAIAERCEDRAFDFGEVQLHARLQQAAGCHEKGARRAAQSFHGRPPAPGRAAEAPRGRVPLTGADRARRRRARVAGGFRLDAAIHRRTLRAAERIRPARPFRHASNGRINFACSKPRSLRMPSVGLVSARALLDCPTCSSRPPQAAVPHPPSHRHLAFTHASAPWRSRCSLAVAPEATTEAACSPAERAASGR